MSAKNWATCYRWDPPNHFPGCEANACSAFPRVHSPSLLPTKALEEMHRYHFHGFWHRNMTAYIKKFPERLNKSEVLAPYRPVESAHQVASSRGNEAEGKNARPETKNGSLYSRSAGICRLVDAPALRTVLPPSVSSLSKDQLTYFNNVAFCWSSVIELAPGFKSTFKSHTQG
jgi:hypothetical protein